MTRWQAMLFAFLLVAVAACTAPATITLDEGSAANAPSFSLSQPGRADPPSITAFRVDACEARGSPPIDTHWLTVAPDQAQPIARIVYGTPPEGWRSPQGPHPLTPGCFRAAIAGAPPLEFDVLADGRVTARR